MTTKQEIKKLLKDRAHSIVDERIITETLDAVAEWTGELMGKLTTLNPETKTEEVDRAFNEIYEGLIKETIEQLEKTIEVRKKKSLQK